MSFVYRAARNSQPNRHPSPKDLSILSTQREPKPSTKSPLKGLSGLKEILTTSPPAAQEDIASLIE